MIRRIQGTEKAMLERTLSELKNNGTKFKLASQSVSVKRGKDIVELQHYEKAPNKTFITIKETVDDSALLTHDRASAQIDNASGKLTIEKSAWKFLTRRKIIKQINQFLKDIQPENRTSTDEIQPCSYGILGVNYAYSMTEKYKDHIVRFFDFLK